MCSALTDSATTALIYLFFNAGAHGQFTVTNRPNKTEQKIDKKKRKRKREKRKTRKGEKEEKRKRRKDEKRKRRKEKKKKRQKKRKKKKRQKQNKSKKLLHDTQQNNTSTTFSVWYFFRKYFAKNIL